MNMLRRPPKSTKEVESTEVDGSAPISLRLEDHSEKYRQVQAQIVECHRLDAELCAKITELSIAKLDDDSLNVHARNFLDGADLLDTAGDRQIQGQITAAETQRDVLRASLRLLDQDLVKAAQEASAAIIKAVKPEAERRMNRIMDALVNLILVNEEMEILLDSLTRAGVAVGIATTSAGYLVGRATDNQSMGAMFFRDAVERSIITQADVPEWLGKPHPTPAPLTITVQKESN